MSRVEIGSADRASTPRRKKIQKQKNPGRGGRVLPGSWGESKSLITHLTPGGDYRCPQNSISGPAGKLRNPRWSTTGEGRRIRTPSARASASRRNSASRTLLRMEKRIVPSDCTSDLIPCRTRGCYLGLARKTQIRPRDSSPEFLTVSFVQHSDFLPLECSTQGYRARGKMPEKESLRDASL